MTYKDTIKLKEKFKMTKKKHCGTYKDKVYIKISYKYTKSKCKLIKDE